MFHCFIFFHQNPTNWFNFLGILFINIIISWYCITADDTDVIEKKNLDHAGGWIPAVNYVAPNFLSQRVPRLLEDNRFELRVFAVNAQGRGTPTTSDEAMPQAQSDVPGKQGKPFAVDADKTSSKSAGNHPPTMVDLKLLDMMWREEIFLEADGSR